MAWSPSTTYSSLSPGLIRNALRIFPGMVVCPLLVTVECGSVGSLPYKEGITCIIMPYLSLTGKTKQPFRCENG